MITEFTSEDVSVEDWIDGVSYLQAQVKILRNPALYSEYQPVMDKIRSLESERDKLVGKPAKRESAHEESVADALSSSTGEESLADSNPLLKEIDGELNKAYTTAEELWERLNKDTEIWHIRRMDEPEVAALRAELGPIPPEPQKPPVNSKPQAKTAHVKKLNAWLKEMQAYADELNLLCLVGTKSTENPDGVAPAVLKVVVNGVEKPAPSLDGIRRVKSRPGGHSQIRDLVTAMEQLSVEGVSIVAPHRPGAGA